MITLRPIERKDNKVIAEIIKATFLEHGAPTAGTVFEDPTTNDLYNLFRKERSLLIIAELDGKVVGCGGIYPTDGLPVDCAEFVKFYIAPEARGIKLGVQIMEQTLIAAKKLGYQSVYLESLPEFSKAVSMYEKFGFKQLPAPIGQSGHTGCNIWMIKAL